MRRWAADCCNVVYGGAVVFISSVRRPANNNSSRLCFSCPAISLAPLPTGSRCWTLHEGSSLLPVSSTGRPMALTDLISSIRTARVRLICPGRSSYLKRPAQRNFNPPLFASLRCVLPLLFSSLAYLLNLISPPSNSWPKQYVESRTEAWQRLEL